jgi:hypothetical protein
LHEIQIVGGSYQGRVRDINSQRSVNFFPMVDTFGEKVLALHHMPGLNEWWDFTTTVPIRGMHVRGTSLFVMVGNTLYEMTVSSKVITATSRGTIGTDSGYVYMADDRTNLLVVDGAEGYVLEADNTFGAIADTDFPVPSSLTYQDGYFLVTKDGSDQVWQSDSLDPLTWGATNFKVASAKPDKALRVISNINNLYVFGEISTEVWYNSGDLDFPFDLVPGGIFEFGTAAAASAAINNNRQLFVLGNDLQVRQIDGLQPKIVSTPQVSFRFASYETTSDAIGYCFSMEGQNFYVLTFPLEKATWVYNTTSGFWSEWQSYPGYNKHRGQCFAWFDNKPLVGDFGNGKVYKLDFDTYTDDGEENISYRTLQAITAKRNRIFFHTLEAELETGTEGVTDAQVALDWSDDGGHTWGNEHLRNMGSTGEYAKRVRWHKLGTSRDRIFRLKMASACKKVIIGGYLNYTVGRD